MRKTIQSLFDFIKYPSFFHESDKSIVFKFKEFLKLYFLTIVLVFFIAALLIILNLILQRITGISILQNEKKYLLESFSKYGKLGFIIVLFVAPVVEESIFRLPLDCNVNNLSVSITLIILRLFGKLYTYNYYLILKIGAGIILFFLFKKIIFNYNKVPINKTFLLYFSIFLFSLLHIGNFYPFEPKLFYVYPLFVLPQFVLGYVLSFLRIRYGIIWSIIFHIFFNLPFSFQLIKL